MAQRGQRVQPVPWAFRAPWPRRALRAHAPPRPRGWGCKGTWDLEAGPRGLGPGWRRTRSRPRARRPGRWARTRRGNDGTPRGHPRARRQGSWGRTQGKSADRSGTAARDPAERHHHRRPFLNMKEIRLSTQETQASTAGTDATRSCARVRTPDTSHVIISKRNTGVLFFQR